MAFSTDSLLRALPALLLIALAQLGAAQDAERTACADEPLSFGFYPYFAPVSYSADEDPESAGFQEHRGYEADLATALEALEGAGLSFERRAIPLWEDIWLQAASAQFDIVSGGITILDTRRSGADGEERVTFTAGHINFRQSLLARAADQDKLDSYDKLTSDIRVGALPGTTGEARLLEITGYVDEDGNLLAGARIETPAGTLVADGGEGYRITAGLASENLSDRIQLHPPLDSLPQVVYLGSEIGERELIEALQRGELDALARGEINSRAVARATDDDLVVSVLDDAVEVGGFALDADAADLVECLDEKINWLTDNRNIGVAEWLDDPLVFMKRADTWNKREQEDEP